MSSPTPDLILVPLTLETTDMQALWQAARHAYLTTGAGQEEDVETILGTEAEPNVPACIRELYWDDSHHNFTTLNEAPIAVSKSLFHAVRDLSEHDDGA